MDTVILVLSAAAVFIMSYGFAWAVRAVRRVGVRRFAGALGALVWAVLVAIGKLFAVDKGTFVRLGSLLLLWGLAVSHRIRWYLLGYGDEYDDYPHRDYDP